MKNERMVRKISVEKLLDILAELYDRGVDFVDLSGTTEDKENAIHVSFTREYMDNDYAEDFEELMDEDFSEEDIKVNEELTDDDITKLM